MGGTIIKDIASIFAIIVTVFIFISALMVKYATGIFIFKWGIVKSILADNMFFLILILLLVLTGAIVAVIAIMHHYTRAMKERRNCQIQYVELSHIASIWLNHEEVELNIREIVETEKGPAVPSNTLPTVVKSLQDYILEVEGVAIDFVKTSVLPYESFLSDYEIRIIFELLDLLQREGEIPSVASLYVSDAEKLAYSKQTVTMSGKTSYEILKEFTLLDHTMRVAKILIKINEERSDSLRKESLYGRLIIAALGHDIGKIFISDHSLRVTGEMYYKTSHENISGMILQEKYPDYAHIGAVISAVKGHHVTKPDGSMAPLLKEADKKAREAEIEIWLVKNKEATAEAVEVGGFEQFQKTNYGSNIDKPELLSIGQINTTENKNSDEIKVETASVTSGDKAFEFGINTDIQMDSGAVPLVDPKTKTNKKSVGQVDENLGYDFLEVYGDTFIRTLHDAANTFLDAENNQGEKIISVSVADLVLYTYIEFKKIIEKTMQERVDNKKLLKIMKQLKYEKFIDFIDVENGYMCSSFSIETAQGKDEEKFVPVFCKMIGYTPEETEKLKREHHKLRSVTVYFGKGVGR